MDIRKIVAATDSGFYIAVFLLCFWVPLPAYLSLPLFLALVFYPFISNLVQRKRGGQVGLDPTALRPCLKKVLMVGIPTGILLALWGSQGTLQTFVQSLFVPIFARHRNFIPIAVAHGLLGLLAYKVLLPHIPTFAVGRGYFLSF